MGEFLRILIDLSRDYLVPWTTVYAGQQGIRYTFGRWVKKLEPGFHLYVPVIQRIENTWVVYQEVDTLMQTFTTKDGHAVVVSANVGYRVRDAAKLHTQVYNFDGTVERAIRVHIFRVLHILTYEEARSGLSELEKEIRRALNEQTREWGVKIVRVGITDFVKARAYRVVNEVPSFHFNPASS